MMVAVLSMKAKGGALPLSAPAPQAGAASADDAASHSRRVSSFTLAPSHGPWGPSDATRDRPGAPTRNRAAGATPPPGPLPGAGRGRKTLCFRLGDHGKIIRQVEIRTIAGSASKRWLWN